LSTNNLQRLTEKYFFIEAIREKCGKCLPSLLVSLVSVLTVETYVAFAVCPEGFATFYADILRSKPLSSDLTDAKAVNLLGKLIAFCGRLARKLYSRSRIYTGGQQWPFPFRIVKSRLGRIQTARLSSFVTAIAFSSRITGNQRPVPSSKIITFDFLNPRNPLRYF